MVHGVVLFQSHWYVSPLVPSKSTVGLKRLHAGFDQSRSLAMGRLMSPACALAQTLMPVPSECWWVEIDTRWVPAVPAWNVGLVEYVAPGGMWMLSVPQKRKSAATYDGADALGVPWK